MVHSSSTHIGKTSPQQQVQAPVPQFYPPVHIDRLHSEPALEEAPQSQVQLPEQGIDFQIMGKSLFNEQTPSLSDVQTASVLGSTQQQ